MTNGATDTARWRRSGFLVQSLVAFFLLLAVVVYTSRVLGSVGPFNIDIAGRSPDTLPAEFRSFLQQSDRRLSLTYFVSHRREMPSHFVDVEASVRQTLEAIRRAAPSRVAYRVIDPHVSGPAAVAYAARKKVSPISVRRVDRDEHAEKSIWSSLVVAYEGYPEFLLKDIEALHLPFLARMLLQHLVALEQPPLPVFAVSAPAGFEQFPRHLSQHGPVVEIDLDHSAGIPGDVDILFWFQPSEMSLGHIRSLRRFVASGRSVVLAGSAYGVDYLAGPSAATNSASADTGLHYRIRHHSDAWTELLQPFGLRPLPDLLMDRNTGPVMAVLDDGSPKQVEAPFHLRNLPAFRDFRKFRTPARGGLSFVATSALQIDPPRVAASGFSAHIVGTTTERAWVETLPSTPFADADLDVALTVPKQNLMVLLTPNDPWAGEILVLASASPFGDGAMSQPGYGHALFVTDIVRSFADSDRLIRTRVDRGEPRTLPPVSPLSRILWRVFVVCLVPTLALAAGAWRLYGHLHDRRMKVGRRGWGMGRISLGSVALVFILGTGLLGFTSTVELDLTRGRNNSLADVTARLLQHHRDGLRVDLVMSARAAMPSRLKNVERRLRSALRRAEIPVEMVRPELLSPDQLRQLRLQGIAPFEVEGVRRDTLTTFEVWSGLTLTKAGAATAIPRLDENTMSHLDFLLAAALRRLDEGRAPHLSVVSDLPRLSPAEALEDYQKKSLSAPQGVDVYSSVKLLLSHYGYRIHHVDPRTPALSPNSDAVLWLQPRRDSSDITVMLSDYLAGGGHAVVALQHFNIQQRQYRGVGFQTVYWPQPQFQDFDPYLRLIGLEQVREVLMDRTRHHLQIDTQVNRTAVREYDPQEVALPFLIRAVGAHYSSDSPVTNHLGDLLFVWGNRFALDAPALIEGGVSREVLVSTSDRSWSFPWKGGWLPDDVFVSTAYLPGRQPLALKLTGPFPAVEFVEDEEGRSRLKVRKGLSSERGSLTLIGCSEMFKNHHLHTSEFQHDQFLLNAVADAALGADMAALQARNRQPRGFAFLEPSSKLWWRLFVLGTAPFIVLLFGLLRYRRFGMRRRARATPSQ